MRHHGSLEKDEDVAGVGKVVTIVLAFIHLVPTNMFGLDPLLGALI